MPVRKVKGGYAIKNTKGKSKTKAAANKRMKAIKANKKKKY
jgi:hypothetical protein|tara:strand:+ start:655 stop:777 length:123 start_codon:yes stop_codon:yes gene_type:complete